MKELETQERAALLLKVQRALDAAGIGRDAIATDDTVIPIDGTDYTGRVYAGRLNVLEAYGYGGNPPIATFTFAELFPELEWGQPRENRYASVDGFDFQAQENGLLIVEDNETMAGLLEFNFRTPERAKRAAQSIADLLAEAGREEA
jgi:hypothetical protein